MARMNVDYDLLTWEGDILRLKFWAQAFEVLKAKGAVYLRTEGRLAGCWVMPIQEDLDAIPNSQKANSQTANSQSDEAQSSEETAAEAMTKARSARRSSSDPTESSRMSARTSRTSSGSSGCSVVTSSIVSSRNARMVRCGRPAAPTAYPTIPSYGGAAYVYNVIDVRQSYLQKLLKQALIAVGHPEGAQRSHHFSYEMVALSHATARELGYAPAPDSEDARRPFVEVSGRKGLGVKADDLLDIVIRKAREEVVKRSPELAEEEALHIAGLIGVAAVRYFLIKFSRGKVIAFDLDEAISFQGETGPYIQYAVVRINNIFRKLQERDGLDEAALVATLGELSPAELTGEGGGHELWSLVLEASRLDEIVEQVIATLEFSVLAKYAFGLAQAFNGFYNLHPSRSSILNEERDNVRRWRAAAVIYVRDQLTRALDLMGIGVPQRM